MSGGEHDLEIHIDRSGNPSDETAHAALRTICAYAEDADEALMMAHMLGIAPGSEPVGQSAGSAQLVDAAPVGIHVRKLSASYGYGAIAAIARTAGVAASTVGQFVWSPNGDGPKLMLNENAQRILAVSAGDLVKVAPERESKVCPCGRVFEATQNFKHCPPCQRGLADAGPVRAHMNRLCAAGWTLMAIGQRAGLPKRSTYIRPDQQWVAEHTAAAILAVRMDDGEGVA